MSIEQSTPQHIIWSHWFKNREKSTQLAIRQPSETFDLWTLSSLNKIEFQKISVQVSRCIKIFSRMKYFVKGQWRRRSSILRKSSITYISKQCRKQRYKSQKLLRYQYLHKRKSIQSSPLFVMRFLIANLRKYSYGRRKYEKEELWLDIIIGISIVVWALNVQNNFQFKFSRKKCAHTKLRTSKCISFITSIGLAPCFMSEMERESHRYTFDVKNWKLSVFVLFPYFRDYPFN